MIGMQTGRSIVSGAGESKADVAYKRNPFVRASKECTRQRTRSGKELRLVGALDIIIYSY
jgi:hypothetical protein